LLWLATFQVLTDSEAKKNCSGDEAHVFCERKKADELATVERAYTYSFSTYPLIKNEAANGNCIQAIKRQGGREHCTTAILVPRVRDSIQHHKTDVGTKCRKY